MESINKVYENFGDANCLIGKRVKVVAVSVKAYRDCDLVGCEGVIKITRVKGFACPYQLTGLGIKILGKNNERSEKGLFWLRPEDLRLIKENDMHSDKYNDKFCIVRDDSKGTTDVAIYYDNVKVGGLVVCDYGYGNGKLSVRRVIEVKEDNAIYPYDAIVIGTVNTYAYDNYREFKAKKLKLEEAMDKAASAVEKEIYYKYLAEHNDTFAKLYKEYEELVK